MPHIPEMPKKDVSEKTKLKALLAQARIRGIKLPENILKDERVEFLNRPFKHQENGYFPPSEGKPYNPCDESKAFISSTARYAFLAGGRGSGKTTAATQKALFKIEKGLPGIISNPDFENLKISTWPEFKKWCPIDRVIPSQRHRLRPGWTPHQPFQLDFDNGAWVLFKGIKDPDSARGPNVNWHWHDEPARGPADGEDWKIASAAVRIGECPQSWATGTPGGKQHYTYTFFIERQFPQEALDEFEKTSNGRELVEVHTISIFDNKENLDPSYYASMLANYSSGWLRQQELYGLFVEQGQSILGDTSWFAGHYVPSAPELMNKRVRFYDLAATEAKIVRGKKANDPDSTIGTLMSWNRTDFYIEDQVGGTLVWGDILKLIYETALIDGPLTRIVVEQEPGSGGINQIAAITEYISGLLPNYSAVIGWRPIGDKITRAGVWFDDAKNGHVWVVNGSWNKLLMDQVSSFPLGTHDDRIDSVSGARLNLAPIKKWRNISFLKV